MADHEEPGSGIIRTMDAPLANKIAAGEVVQRPASVEKELLENAIDAGATSIEVIVQDAGSTLVQVVDDGCGMSAADAEQCFARHATSKIRGIDDLERIRTLGFRGEALASIAAVAQVELKTKRVEDDVGTAVRIEGGEVMHVRPCAAPNGTSMAVRNLFYNVPARRNFLKTPSTELKHLLETFQFLALSHPEVAFSFAHNDHTHYDLPAARTSDFFAATRRRIRDLMGARYDDGLVRVERSMSDATLRGFVSAPSAHRKTRGDQFLFVNDRYVRDRYLSHAVRTGYGDLLPEGAFPFFALFLSVDPRRVDVNVHPTKAEVKFDDESGLYNVLRVAVREAVRAEAQAPRLSADDSAGPDASPDDPPSFQPRAAPAEGARSATQPAARSAPNAASPQDATAKRKPRPDARSTAPTPGASSDALYRPVEAPADDAETTAGDNASLQEAPSGEAPLWSVHGRYLLQPVADGLLLVDQRAAHRRVCYEQALDRMAATEAGASQQLLFPHTMDLSAAEATWLEAWEETLRGLGFDLERLSGATWTVRGVPPDVPPGRETSVLEAVMDDLKTSGTPAAEQRREALAQTWATRVAVPHGTTLPLPARRALLRDLHACDMPYAAPDGQPTFRTVSLEELQAFLEA
ncbi:DNA mismatch repair endonuclease MutL [Salisaeta longa]|uniref:DNA mismatch repair endonuclease MutL n=1 Tax=Salisaeta longa TaxID=503170 RepID=UPI00040A19FB|nr:DNA mismatch repair endonuclease MutL [Salisaeta longa]